MFSARVVLLVCVSVSWHVTSNYSVLCTKHKTHTLGTQPHRSLSCPGQLRAVSCRVHNKVSCVTHLLFSRAPLAVKHASIYILPLLRSTATNSFHPHSPRNLATPYGCRSPARRILLAAAETNWRVRRRAEEASRQGPASSSAFPSSPSKTAPTRTASQRT